MDNIALSRDGHGHPGDVIAEVSNGTAGLIRTETMGHFLVQWAAPSRAYLEAIGRDRVGPDRNSGHAYFILLCPHGVRVSERLPEAAES